MSSSHIKSLLILLTLITITLQRRPYRIKLHATPMHNDIRLNNMTSLLLNATYLVPTARTCIGTPGQCLNLAFNTRETFTVVESAQAKSKYLSHQFNPRDSYSYTTHYEREISFKLINEFYPATAKQSAEYFRIEEDSEQPSLKFKFLMVEMPKQTKAVDLDGFIGLQKFVKCNATVIFHDYAYSHHLFRTMNFEHLTAALSYNEDGSGLAVFGADLRDYAHCDPKITFIHQNTWNCFFYRFQMGKQGLFINSDLVFDSLASYVEAPAAQGGKYIQDYLIELSNGKCRYKHEKEALRSFVVCDKEVNVDKFPDLELKLGSGQLIVQWRHMFKTVVNNDVEVQVCLFVVNTSNMHEIWLIGRPGFIMNTIGYDYERKVMAVRQNYPGWRCFYIAGLCVILMVIMIIGIRMLCLARKRSSCKKEEACEKSDKEGILLKDVKA